MANRLYAYGRENILRGLIHWETDTIKVTLVDTGNYNFSDQHAALVSLIAGTVGVDPRIGTPQTLTGRTAPNGWGGVVDANDVVFPSVSGASAEALVIYKDTGDPNTSLLIAYMDTVTGLPVTPTGANISIFWDNGTNKIFRI